MIEVPAGKFLMGSPAGERDRDDDEQQHKVEISRAFEVAESEVTQGQYQRVMGANPSDNTECGASCPVESVTWQEAVKYCDSLSRLEKVPAAELCYHIDGETVTMPHGLKCGGYRLLTEAEFEYVARGGGIAGRRFGETDREAEVCGFENVWDKSGGAGSARFPCDDGYAGLAPVKRFRPNELGLYDLNGNAWEWVWDWYGGFSSKTARDPLGPVYGRGRVARGGSFGYSPRLARVANRYWASPSDRYRILGFRVARSLP
jgi:formylglycine-generating enzyme required for sulfatase activity